MTATLDTPSTLLSFSGGTRGCPGRHLAVMIMQQVVSLFVQRFVLAGPTPGSSRAQWDPASGFRAVRKWAEWPADGIAMHLTVLADKQRMPSTHRRPSSSSADTGLAVGTRNNYWSSTGGPTPAAVAGGCPFAKMRGKL